MTSRIRAIIASVVATLLILTGLLATNPAAAAPAPPSGLKAVSASRTAIAVVWKATSSAPGYHVQYSASSTMANPGELKTGSARGEIIGLEPGRTYYVRVRSISTDGTGLSAFSGVTKAKTASANGYSHLSPRDLKVAATASNSVSLGWASRGDGVRYRASWSRSASFRKPEYRRVTGTTVKIAGLNAASKYYFKVRVISENNSNRSAYSPAITATTAKGTSGWELQPPAKLKVTATARTSVALSWNEVSGANRYRVQYSTSSSMRSAKYARVSGGSTELRGLKSNKKYYFKIRVINPDGSNRSAYSRAVSARTAKVLATSYLPPNSLKLSAAGSAKLNAGWSSRGSGLTYEVLYAESAGLGKASSVVTTATKASLGGLKANTTYFVAVRVVAGAVTRGVRSSLSAVQSMRTRTSSPTALRVGSYNVKCATCFAGAANEGTWYQRRDAVVATIRAQKPDVIGIQEASQAWLKDSAGKSISLSQFEDLTNRLGTPYKLANKNRNNCVKSTTPTNCVYKDQGASQGTKIIYNSSTLELIAQGSKQLSQIASSDNDRYVAWAILEQKASGKRFFFADTHLEPKVDEAGAYFALRATQTQEIVTLVKNQGLPTYVVGDFNSSKWTLPSNGPYDVMVAAGFVDPLGNTYRSTHTAPGATVENRIRTNFASFNGFVAAARKSPSYINGTYLDYIWTSPGIAVPEWETVVNLDPADNFVGVIPSDHNMLRATTLLP